MKKQLIKLAIVTLAGVGFVRSTALAITDVWTAGTSGNYSNNGSWSNNVPGSTDDVFINSDPQTNVSVSLDINAAARTLTIDAGDGLVINNNRSYTLAGGSLVNNGTITVNPNNPNYPGVLDFASNTALSGSGQVILANGGTGAQFNTDTGAVVTQSTSHTLRGGGQVNAALINHGFINADAGTSDYNDRLTLQTNDKSNDGTLQASLNSYLNFNGATITNTGGTILAAGGTVLFNNNVNIIGGTLTSTGTGLLFANGGARLSGVTLSNGSLFNVRNNNTIMVAGGSLVNNGTITVNPDNPNFATVLDFTSNTALSGTGQVILAQGGAAAQFNTDTGVAVTQSASHSVSGLGEVNATLINHGVVNANINGQFLTLQTNDKTNDITLEATAGGILNLNGTTITNSGGTILADGGTVRFNNNVNIIGGTLRSTGTSTLVANGDATLTGVTLSGGSLFNINNTHTVRVAGGSLVNNGAITINPDNPNFATVLDFTSNTALSGNGQVILAQGGAAAQFNTDAGSTVTQAASQTLNGFGQVNAALINHGVVNANINGQFLTLQSNNKTNDSTLEATGGGILSFNGTTITNNSGTILADGGTVLLSNVNIVGGTLTGTGTSTFFAGGGATLTGVALSSGTLFNINNNNTVNVAGGSLVNNGTITVNPDNPNFATVLDFNSNTSLSGTGQVILANGGAAAQFNTDVGATVTQGTCHTLRGTGNVNALLVNNGLVSADVANSMNLNGPSITNNGVLAASQSGVLQQAGNSILTNYNATTQTLTGGTYLTKDSSTLNLNIGSIAINAATIILSGSGSFGPINAIQQNWGTLDVLGGRSFTTAGDLASAGTVKLDENSQINVTGNYSQGTNSRMYIEIGSTGPNPSFHVLNATGSAALAGTLDVRLVNGFVPSPTQTYTIINGASRTGGFTQVHGASVTYTATSVIIHPNGGAIPLALTSAVSRKTHQASGTVAGTFDVNLPLMGSPGVECRSGGANGDHTLILTFNNDVVSGTASVTAGTATLSGPPVFPCNPNINNIPRNTMIVNLTGVTNAQNVTVTLTNVTDTSSQVLPATPVSVGFLLGDTNADRSVNSGDALQTRNRSGQTTNATNFRSDVNVDGAVNSGDSLAVRSRSGTFLP